VLGLCAGALGPMTISEPFSVTWQGNTYPEQDGWARTICGGGAERSLSDGSLVLDGLASTDISDFYRREVPSDPGPGEVFHMEWRPRVHEEHGSDDTAIASMQSIACSKALGSPTSCQAYFTATS
jgi:hypothetical protein